MNAREALEVLDAKPPTIPDGWTPMQIAMETARWRTDDLPVLAKRAQRAFHPDNLATGDEARFKRIEEAVAVLEKVKFRKTSAVTCGCGGPMPRGNFCTTCGRRSSNVEGLTVCPTCSHPRPGDFCGQCGFSYKLKGLASWFGSRG